MKKCLWVMMVCLTMMADQTAEAKRIGGGRSIGQQSGNVSQRHAAPAQGSAPHAARPIAPQPTPLMPTPNRPWGSMLGGLAAGMGLAWLGSSMGLGVGSFGIMMLLALLVVVAIILFKRRPPGLSGPSGRYVRHTTRPFAFAGAGATGGINQPVAYRPDNVGNDASARPWELRASQFDIMAASQTSLAPGTAGVSGLAGASTWCIPPGFDTEGFLKSAKANFVFLQAAWDRSDITALRSMVTDTMLAEIQAQMADRGAQKGNPDRLTEVVMLEARLLGIEDCGDHYLASVEFSGVIQESPVEDPCPFCEVWNMARPKNNTTGWLVAGVQTLQ